MMSIGMHCRLLRAAGALQGAAEILGLHRVPRPGLDLPPARHRAALEGDASIRRQDRFRMGLSLEALNAASLADFVRLLDGVYEHSPWIAERAHARRPAGGFVSQAQLERALVEVVREASEAEAPGAWAAEIRPAPVSCQGQSRRRRGVGSAPTTSRQRRVAPQIAPARRVGPGRGAIRRCTACPGGYPDGALRLASPFGDQRGPGFLPPTLPSPDPRPPRAGRQGRRGWHAHGRVHG